MADYWKSIDKKYCNFCRTWITNNRPSVEFHERGRRHKHNVEKKLKFLTKQKEAERKVENTNAEILARLEKDAIKAYQKDLINNPELLKAVITDQIPVVIPDQIAPEPTSPEEVSNDKQEPSTSTEEIVYDPDYIGQLQRAKMSWETVKISNIEDPVIYDNSDEDSVEFQKNTNSTIDYCPKVEYKSKLEPEPEEAEQEQFTEKILETNLDDRKESCTFKKRKLANKNLRKQNLN